VGSALEVGEVLGDTDVEGANEGTSDDSVGAELKVGAKLGAGEKVGDNVPAKSISTKETIALLIGLKKAIAKAPSLLAAKSFLITRAVLHAPAAATTSRSASNTSSFTVMVITRLPSAQK
jgi:hypothetical protein